MANGKTLVLRVEEARSGKVLSQRELPVPQAADDGYSIGRDGESTIRLDNQFVSAQQGVFFYDRVWKYQDTGSNKPTLTNPSARQDIRARFLAEGGSINIIPGDYFKFGPEQDSIALRILTPEQLAIKPQNETSS